MDTMYPMKLSRLSHLWWQYASCIAGDCDAYRGPVHCPQPLQSMLRSVLIHSSWHRWFVHCLYSLNQSTIQLQARPTLGFAVELSEHWDWPDDSGVGK